MVVQHGPREESKGEMAYVRRLHGIEQSLPERQIPTTQY